MNTEFIKAIKFNGYKIELRTNIKGQPVAELSKYITVGKNKDTYKRELCYYFATEERRAEWCKEQMTKIKDRVKDKDDHKAKLKSVKDNFVNPFKVGEVYYDSWGYDQTNIDFYLITEVKSKSVMIQRIGGTHVENTLGFMCANVKPDITNKIGDPEIKIIQIRIWNNKETSFIKSHHGWISKYDAGERGVYSSWYA